MISLVAIPAAARAAETFGSDLVGSPSPIGHPAYSGGPADCNNFAGHPCTLAGIGVHRSNEFPVGAPIPGVVVRFRIRSLTTDTIGFRILRRAGSGFETYQGVGTGPTVSLAGTGAIETYAATPPIPVASGDVVGFDEPTTPIAQTANCDLQGGWFEFSPPIANGGTGAADANSTCELLVNADVETDLDRDGIGDETDSSVVVPACGYLQEGTGAADSIEGFALGDRILGHGGNDRLRGLEGRDCLEGGGGGDILTGGPSRDRLSGGAGADRIQARDGADDRVDCGGGPADRATVDPGDHVQDCETVVGD